jgi:hypothetical protein
MRIPVDFAMGITSGFHNAPKLYGDDTVRPAHKVTGFNSGLSAASKVSRGILCFCPYLKVLADEAQEFGHGVYDGVTGLVSQPVMGAKKDGVSGFFKGVAKGLGGAVLKPGAGKFARCTKFLKEQEKEREDFLLTKTSALWYSRIRIQRHPPRNPEPFRRRSSELHHLHPQG